MKMMSVAVASVMVLMSTGCMVAGYSSGSGFFLWPGLGTLLVILLVVMLLRRR